MNCQDFENNLDDLSQGALMDARTRSAALAHADECRRCDTRLADQKTLRAGLRSLAAASDGEAPPRVESALLAAFRSQAAAKANEDTSAPVVVADSNVAPLRRRAGEKQWSWMKTLATAATAAAAAAVLLMIIPPGMDAPSGDTVADRASAGPKEDNPQVSRMIEPARTGADDGNAPEVAKNETPRAFNSPRGGRVTAIPASYNPSANRRAQPPRGGSRGARPDREVVTEFIPLGNGDYSASDDAGQQVVRVELPRSALSSIGLPVSADRAGERIKADVLVGEDVLARAIRFVR